MEDIISALKELADNPEKAIANPALTNCALAHIDEELTRYLNLINFTESTMTNNLEKKLKNVTIRKTQFEKDLEFADYDAVKAVNMVRVAENYFSAKLREAFGLPLIDFQYNSKDGFTGTVDITENMNVTKKQAEKLIADGWEINPDICLYLKNTPHNYEKLEDYIRSFGNILSILTVHDNESNDSIQQVKFQVLPTRLYRKNLKNNCEDTQNPFLLNLDFKNLENSFYSLVDTPNYESVEFFIDNYLDFCNYFKFSGQVKQLQVARLKGYDEIFQEMATLQSKLYPDYIEDTRMRDYFSNIKLMVNAMVKETSSEGRNMVSGMKITSQGVVVYLKPRSFEENFEAFNSERGMLFFIKAIFPDAKDVRMFIDIPDISNKEPSVTKAQFTLPESVISHSTE